MLHIKFGIRIPLIVPFTLVYILAWHEGTITKVSLLGFTHFLPLLGVRGIKLSSAQIVRLVA